MGNDMAALICANLVKFCHVFKVTLIKTNLPAVRYILEIVHSRFGTFLRSQGKLRSVSNSFLKLISDDNPIER